MRPRLTVRLPQMKKKFLKMKMSPLRSSLLGMLSDMLLKPHRQRGSQKKRNRKRASRTRLLALKSLPENSRN